ncbi:uncharacterized protein LODBEIA_P58460 [Lodderomyces beijingensis]|uniref:Major facilitator superfamily (MFS) profile domain-containing protein n=1 Tax=Lodderomyces beijingensis TaxID=1775926 RepID=A0ABP0ZU19_9ASCO
MSHHIQGEQLSDSQSSSHSRNLLTKETFEGSDEANGKLDTDLEQAPQQYHPTGENNNNNDNYDNDGDILLNYYPDMINAESDPHLSREISRRITNSGGSFRTVQVPPNSTMHLIGEGRELPPSLPDRTPYTVSFAGVDDPYHPHNYPMWKKVMFSICVAFSALSVSLGSAMFSNGNEQIMEEFHVGWTVAALGTSLYVFGFAAGPVIHGPMCEILGRKFIMVLSCLGYVSFSFGVSTAKDIQTVMICRFFAGFIGSAPYVVAPAVMVDLFRAQWRGVAIAIFVCMLFGGPVIAPVLGGFTAKNSSLGWRWCSYFSAIVGCLALFCNTFLLEETHHPLLLAKKAEFLRRHTGNWGIFAPHEEVSLDLKEIVESRLARPIKLLFTEPIIFLISIYNAFIYGMLYMFLTAVPLIFQTRYHWRQGVAELPYISMLLGVFSGGGMIVLYELHVQKRQMSGGRKVTPEDRLPPVMVGGFTFVIGIFWMGWTGDYAEHVHWIVPTIGAFFIGNGLMAIFLPTMNYVIDCYLFIAATALAANTFVRSSVAAAFPLFARQMFVNLTIKWASTLVGCLALLMIPLPFLFYRYGAAIRRKSKYALH